MLNLEMMKGESLGSYVLRNVFVSGTLKGVELTRCLFYEPLRSWRILPRPSSDLANMLTAYFGKNCYRSFVENNSLIPVYRPVANPFVAENSYGYLTSTTASKWSKFFRQENFDTAEILYSQIKHCGDCMKVQRTEQGFAWFVRDWQVPGAAYCSIHEKLLETACCTTCRGSSSCKIAQSILLGRCSVCGASLTSTPVSATSRRFGSWMTALLNSNLPRLSSGLIKLLLKGAALKLNRNRDSTGYGLTLAQCLDPNVLESTFMRQYNASYTNRSNSNERSFEHRINIMFRTDSHEATLPTVCLFYPLSVVFPDFLDFERVLREVSENEPRAFRRSYSDNTWKEGLEIKQQIRQRHKGADLERLFSVCD